MPVGKLCERKLDFTREFLYVNRLLVKIPGIEGQPPIERVQTLLLSEVSANLVTDFCNSCHDSRFLRSRRLRSGLADSTTLQRGQICGAGQERRISKAHGLRPVR